MHGVSEKENEVSGLCQDIVTRMSVLDFDFDSDFDFFSFLFTSLSQVKRQQHKFLMAADLMISFESEVQICISNEL